MNTPLTTRVGPLVVSSKVLGHISEGLYRGPAGVIKELISNAYDANAKTVWISTGRPTFDVVSVKDDGDGMTLDKFERLMSGGIGDSDKRLREEPLINGRKTIGRLGIGILGVSQISHEFSIVSHSRDTETAFEATVQMKDFRSEILDQEPDPSPTPDDGSQEETQGFQVGGYKATDIPYEPNNAGLTITATDPTEGFRLQMSEDNPIPLPKAFSDFARWALEKDKLATGPWYNQMIWQIASLIPVPYMPNPEATAGDEAMTKIAQALEDFEFDVVIDGVKLYKPILLQGPAVQVAQRTVGGVGAFHFPLEFDSEVWGSPLQIRGYIHASGGTVLHPDEMRGLLIRIKHIGIGGYDKSFLGYRYAEGPRFGWLTGELFVDEGLEDALTVGRDAFDGGHPHYIALRKWIHDELRSRVFPTLHRGYASRRKIREVEKQSIRSQGVLDAISEFAGSQMEIKYVHEPGLPPVSVDLENGVASINGSARWPGGKRQRETIQNICLIFELVHSANAERDALEDFKELAEKLLSMR